ncbi:Filamentation induced by cAMP protein Fic [[Actinomadura] parvosata subsp. kistnae]|uniref:Cell filamentation protein Fic n=1 Tax=[Actinomadura] parvosata subsp. kistnae TaxID=1909395 RepID=A0A1U9ZQL6_9ACTN|nr:Fic family protein [Nonomuraea sp. ATCC 55076]AQZ60236.1 cell filamentation protein Fic [Nonomuraea sp. ATCC 55076]SPL91275.1 Filamentation induced by cAMP protein Fic [Actinomadura parvosata subsp. kistnae]
MLYSTPRLDKADLQALEDIERMRHDLRLHLRPQARWTKQLRRSLTARAIVGSNTIEGYAASVDDVEALMAGEEPLESSESTRRELEGYQRAMTYIQGLADAGEQFRYDLGLLNGLHFMIQEPHTNKRPGRLRQGPVYVTSPDDPAFPAYTGPDPESVPGLMNELVEWLNEGDLDAPVHVRASMAHLNLVKIHPWADGNGRMSRALSTLVFAREAVLPAEFSSIEEWLGRGQNTYAYYQILQEVGGPVWSPERDTHPWITFCLRAHHFQAQQAKRRVDLLSRAWRELSTAMADAGLDDRTVFALLPAFWSSRVRRTVYQQDADLSPQQAVRDIRELCRRGWLTPQGQARGRYYVAGPSMQPVLESVQQSTKPYVDPYR